MDSPIWYNNENEWKVVYNENGDPPDHWSDGRKTLAQTLSIPKSMCILSDKKTELSTVTELSSPRLKLPQLGNETVERVFPVRSVVSFDSTPSSALQTPSLDKLESPMPPLSDSIRPNTGIEDRSGISPRRQASDLPAREKKPRRPSYLTRMHHQASISNISPSLLRLPPRHRENSHNRTSSSDSSSEDRSPFAQLQNTIREGAYVLTRDELTKGLGYFYEDENNLVIQPFGALLVVSCLSNKTIVQAASTNSREILGHSADDLFELESIAHILSASEGRKFFSHVKYVLQDEYDVQLSGPEVFPLELRSRRGDTRYLWCTMHTSRVYQNYIICELEPNVPESHDGSNNAASQGHDIHTKLAQGSTVSDVKPGYEENCKIDESEIVNALPRIVRNISGSQTLESLVNHTMRSLQQLTAFERTTMYHFDSDRNGIVVADLAEASLGVDSFEGLEFPESSFSEELKNQHLRNTVSFSYRKNQDVATLAYRASTIKMGLDLSHCYLLAAPGSSESKSELPVQACLSIGIYVFGKLWGLISCQSYDESIRLHPLVQRTCWILSETISSNIERLSYTLPFLARQDLCTDDRGPKQELQRASGDLVSLFGADYATASIMGETRMLGKPPDSQEALALLEYFYAKDLNTVLWSTDVTSDFEDLDYSPGFRHVSGLIYIPLSSDGQDFIVFFRRETGTEQRARGTEAISTSSEESTKIDKTRQTEWSAADIGKASILSLLYRTFTEIWQEKEATMQNNQLMRLLLANSAHEFRTPLNAIINYLEIALDGNINQETRDNLSRSHSASKSLVYIINDLLDLTNAENGQKLIKDEVFSLSETLCEATDIFWEEARQKHVDLQVVQHAALPAVLGDQRRVRQVITNLISNAVQHTSAGAVTIESCILSDSCEPGYIAVEVAIHDTGSGMSEEAVETLFCELEQVSNKEYMQSPRPYSKSSDVLSMDTESVLGLGLALVARIVRNMDGQLSLKSEEGKGSCFKIRLKFPLPSDEDDPQTALPSSCDKDTWSHIKGCDVENSNEQSCKEKGGIPCKCGEPFLSDSAIGRVDSPLVDADIALKNGESRNLTILASGAKVEDV